MDIEAVRHFAVAELGYLIVFSVFLFVRGFIPAVAGPNIIDQEKPMDLMMLSSSMQATAMPPLDAWMSGETINYYYLGYTMWGAVGTMIGVTPWVAFNLAVVSIFAMTCISTLGTVANILSSFTTLRLARIGGLLGAILVLLIGNPWAAWQVWRDIEGQWSSGPFQGVMWTATRIIDVTPNVAAISEFPAFSFLFADLHPHLMAMPYAITALAFAWMFATDPVTSSRAMNITRTALAGVTVTALYAINSWDFPTWFALVALAILVSPGFPGIGQRVLGIVVALTAGVVAWSPFILTFEAPVRDAEGRIAETLGHVPVFGGVFASLGQFTGERTSIQDYLAIFGFFYFILVAALATILVADGKETNDPFVNKLAAGSALMLVAIGVLLPAPLVILLGLPLLAAVVIILRSENVTLQLLIAGLAGLSFVLTLIPEFFYLLDIFGTRMNTIFKLYLQVWLLSGVAGALALIYLWRVASAWKSIQAVVAVVGAVIILGGFTYPVVAWHQWSDFKNPDGNWHGVDGLSWLEESYASDPATYDAVEWLWHNASNDDVVLAAGGCDYRSPLGLPSAASGVPSIIGWEGHQRQWRLYDEGINDEITDRVAAVVDLFARPTDEVLDEYGVTLIYVGRAETDGINDTSVEPSPTCAPGPFPETTSPEFPGPGWSEAFNEDGVRIFRRDRTD
jgi:YYY domain-containing protein